MPDYELELRNDGTYTYFNAGLKFDNSLINTYKVKPTKKSEILPPVVRYINYESEIVVLERPPIVRKIRFKNAPKHSPGTERFFNIPIPWQIYIHYNHRTYAFLRPTQLESLSDPIYVSWIPNVITDGILCLSSYGFNHKDAKIKNSPVQRMLYDINVYWTSLFNLNAYDGSYDAIPKPLQFAGQAPHRSFCIDELKLLEKLETLSLEDVTNPKFYEGVSARSLERYLKSQRTNRGMGDLYLLLNAQPEVKSSHPAAEAAKPATVTPDVLKKKAVNNDF